MSSSGSDEVQVFDGETGDHRWVFLEQGEVLVPCGLAFDSHVNSVASAKNPDAANRNHAGGVFCYDWSSRVRIARIHSQQTCGLDFGRKDLLYIVFAGTQQVGKYLLRYDRLKIIDDMPFPKTLSVSK